MLKFFYWVMCGLVAKKVVEKKKKKETADEFVPWGVRLILILYKH